MTSFRIGQGFDLHCIVEGRQLFIGGVNVPAPFGLEGHSDADALLHAITDAFLGAFALGDIGQWFPDNDPQFLNADSRILLKTVLSCDQLKQWKLVNLDCTIFAERPKIAPWREAIRASLAAILDCDISQVSVKAKTNEKQDAIGQGKALAAAAIVLLEHL